MSMIPIYNEETNPKVLMEAKGIPIVVKELVPFISREISKIYNKNQRTYNLTIKKEDIKIVVKFNM